MAIVEKLQARLTRRFNGINDDQITAVIADAIELHEYANAEAVPVADLSLLLAYTSAELATELSVNAASYFSFTDGEESIDKTKVMANYSALADKFKIEYQAELAAREEVPEQPAVFSIMKRADRT